MEDSRKTSKIKGNIPLCIAILCLIISWGCAKKDVLKNIPDEEELRNRILMYWEHKVKEEFDKSYAYEDPLYKKNVNMVNYIKGVGTTRAKWIGASVAGINREGDHATVGMKIKLRIYMAPQNIEQDVAINEKWVKVDGVWYHVP